MKDTNILNTDQKLLLESHEGGYAKALKPRQIQMIAMGGAIGTGLFLGAGARLQLAGPALAIVYLVCGLFSFFILRALGELVMYRPTSGSFVSYAREFLGERGSFVAGWLYYLNWAMTGIIDITAVALYMHYWGTFSDVPQYIFAFVALVLVGSMNMINVKWFGEMEFWFSLVKVGALVIFLITGVVILMIGHPIAGQTPGLHLISQNSGIFPHGVLPAVIIVQGVVFAYAGIEIIGTAAGEAQDVKQVLPRAINRGKVEHVAFRMPFAPFSSWITLGFLLTVLVLTAFDYPNGTYTIAAIPAIAIALALGWIVMKRSNPFSSTT